MSPSPWSRYRWLALGLVLVTANVSDAQSSGADSGCAYERCAVWLDGRSLRKGSASNVVLRDGFLRSMRLAAFVGGSDSATAWATKFESRAKTGNTMAAIGLAAMVVGFGTQYLRVRHRPAGVIDDGNAFEASLVFGGALTFAGGSLVRATAERHRGRAIWWYNRRFSQTSSR